MFTRIVAGRARVVREVRAAGPLMQALGAPVPARGPWLTAVLNAQVAHRSLARPLAVVVESHRQGRPEGVAFLTLQRRWSGAELRLLGSRVAPDGAPAARLLARDDEVADRLAAGVAGVVRGLRGPARLRLSGLPLGDPTARALAARLDPAVLGTRRTECLVDELGPAADVQRTRDPRALERWLPALLAREPDRRARTFLRSAARLHAAIGQLELAVAPGNGPDGLRAALLTLVAGAERWPWWGTGEGLRSRRGAPVAELVAPARGWPA